MANRRVTMTSDVMGRHNRGKTITVDATQFQWLVHHGYATVADAGGLPEPPSTTVSSTDVRTIVTLTTAEYEALATPDPSTLYLVTD